jgi:BirA family transcriptional regulator, biotin operon repressor / biotin---[acetyl-CoA-carboxylase] ligase
MHRRRAVKWGMDSSTLHQILASTGINAVRYVAQTGSTNNDALAWLTEGVDDFSVIVADEQTAGRGRFERKWVTHPGVALAFTVVFHPREEELPYIHLFSPLAGIAVAAGLDNLLHLRTQIKWPNDVLIERAKVCGILSETAWNGAQIEGIVVGIGINVLPESIPPAEAVSFRATCLQKHLSDPIDRWQVLAAILQQMKDWRAKLGRPEFFQYWQEHLAFAGEEVEIQGALGAEVSGRLVGIDPSGELLIETEAGEVSVQVGDVHLRLRG